MIKNVLWFVGGWSVISICLGFFLSLIACGMKRSVEK